MGKARAVKEKLAFALLILATLVVILPTLYVVSYIFFQGLPAISWEFLSGIPRQGMREGGIFPAIIGTIYLVLGTLLVAVPLGVGSAVYLTQYAPRGRLTRAIRLAIVNLAGVPSVVYGLFGLGLFVLFLGLGASLIAASLTLGFLILPVIITTAEEALSAVPFSFQEASLALGATKWQTVRRVVLPNALPGILTGTILGVGRAAGETAPILFTGAAFFLPHLPSSVFDQFMALPYHLYVLVTQVPNVPKLVPAGTALVLLGLVLGLNTVAIVLRIRFRSMRKW